MSEERGQENGNCSEKGKKKKVECQVCGALLLYDPDEDVEKREKENAFWPRKMIEETYYITCQQCRSEVSIGWTELLKDED